ncbi:LOW QUALITY PROTEIN: DENN domain-containing protein 1B, partial [Myotis lucifugus]|uniref:LOW QUALITY PROTEIN: DENN domain-containing protein 1B n=1 Tax=Myotis lucifugus TaxID=59463 RepID=UPI000CCC993A
HISEHFGHVATVVSDWHLLSSGRKRENPERTFDLVLNVKCHASEGEDPVVLWKFPEDFGDQEVLKSVPKFCFPLDVERVSQNQVGQHFAFVLTDIESKQRFGFCRLTSGGRICLCILSYLPWFEVYYKLLNTLADYLAKEQENDLNAVLTALYNHPVPKANSPVNLSVNQEIFIASEQVLRDQPSLAPHSYFIAPDVTGLPTIPESRNLTEYFVAVDVSNMLQLYASMLHERRILITSSKLSTLTACLHGSAALLYPMFWQHIYIPVLPPHLLDYCCAPMPYLIGVHSSLIERVRNKSLEDVVMLNVDTNTLESPFHDLDNLPSDVVSALKAKLKKQSTATGDGVARAFLRAQAALFGCYRDALRYKPVSLPCVAISICICFSFKNKQTFFFIDGRLAKLNAGKGFSDAFEEEITSGGFSGGSPRSYQQWVHTVKKGGALFNSAMTRATPAVRTAYKYAKSHAKQGIKEVKSKLKHKETEDECGAYSSFVLYTPVYTLHNHKGPSGEKRRLTQTRLHRPLKSLDDGAPCEDEDEDMDRASKLSSEDGEEAAAYSYESDDSVETRGKTLYSGEMDLLGEILDTLSTHSSDPGKLAAAKSLDFFCSMDNIDYQPANKSSAPSEDNLAALCGGSGDQGDWLRGQDDSALHGRHLPPSPRKRASSSCATGSLFSLKEENSARPLDGAPGSGPHGADQPAPASELGVPRAPPDAAWTEEGKADEEETLIQAPDDLLIPSLGRRPSSSVPWEKEGNGVQGAPGDPGPLHEAASLCPAAPAFQPDGNVPAGSPSGNQASVKN